MTPGDPRRGRIVNGRVLTWVAFPLILISCVIYFFKQTEFYATFKDTVPSGAITATVKTGSIEEIVLANGTLEPVNLVRVGSQVSGQIKAVHAKVGQAVRKGDLIAEVDAIPQQNALRIAEAKRSDIRAQRQLKEAQLTFAQIVYKRHQELVGGNAVSKMAFDDAKTQYLMRQAEIVSLDAKLEQSEIEMRTAYENLGYTRIRAPISGIVLAVVVEQGQTLNSVQTTPLVAVLANLDEMLLKIRISEADIPRTKVGQKVWFTTIGEPSVRYESALESIEYAPPSISSIPEIGSTSENAKIVAIYYNGLLKVRNYEHKLRPKMTAEVRIIVSKADRATIIPNSTLSSQQPDGRYIVRVLTQDRIIEERIVETGLSDGVNVQILKGLNVDENVLIAVSN